MSLKCFVIALAILCGVTTVTSARLATQVESLRPGEYVWTPQLAPSGPMVVVVSLPRQQAYVYRNGARIGVSTVSTGKSGHETPAGVYTILQKHREHYSNLYDNAPMPYMQRLTWSGIALHAGRVPGYPASHGCIRLPAEFAERLFAETVPGTVVVVAASGISPPSVTSPGLFAPIDTSTGAAWTEASPATADYVWNPELAPEGPITVLLSTRDRKVVVIRNAVQIGQAVLKVEGAPLQGTHAYVLLEGMGDGPSRIIAGRPALRWMSLSVPDGETDSFALRDAVSSGRISLSQEFLRFLHDALRPGATIIATDEPLSPREIERTVMETVPSAGVNPK